MKNYQTLGHITLGSALRGFAEQITQDVEAIYTTFNFNIEPKWFPVFYVLAASDKASVVSIAKEINYSHAAVSKIIKGMKAAGLINTQKSSDDSRITLLSLSTSAKKMIPAMEQQCAAVDTVMSQLISDTGVDIWQAITLTQHHLKHNTLSQRIHALNHSADIRIIDYAPKHSDAFKQLNITWISEHWDLEQPDIDAIENPETYIINKGGAVLLALDNHQVIGCCALIKMDTHTYELAKMAVTPSAKGKGIGLQLGKAVIERAKALGAQRIFLESNAILTPAINLYRKLGFADIEGVASPYQRCNVQMEKFL